MKQLLLLVFIVCSVYFIVSCTKTNNVTTTIHDTTVEIIHDTTVLTTPKNPITGTWTGFYKVNGGAAPDSFSYTFFIRADDTLITIGNGTNGGAGYSYGAWQLNGVTFTSTITSLEDVSGQQQSLTATYDSVSGALRNGTFVDIAGTNLGTAGTFYLKRVD